MWKKYCTVPNLLTALRLVGAFVLLFLGSETRAFLIVFGLSGLTDALDGPIARRTGQVTLFGSRFDSATDLCFYFIMMLKILPKLWALLPRLLWYVIAAVILLRLSSYGIAAIRFRCFASMHTYLNKLSGLLMYLLPFALVTRGALSYCTVVVTVTAFATLEEFVIHLTAKEYNANRKTLLAANKYERRGI